MFQHSTGLRAWSTCGMSRDDHSPGLEVHLITKDKLTANQSNAVVEDLAMVAHFHATGARLGLAHSVHWGQPWLAGSACRHAVLCLPYLDGPKLEVLDAPSTRFLWLLPVTPAELEFKKIHGLEALEERFEAAQFDYADPLRPSVI